MAVDAFAALNRVLDAPNTAPGSIRKACLAVEDCVATCRDNLRAFFDVCFPTLLKRVFGYDFEASWLNMVAKPGREADAAALLALLAPNSRLFGAILSADADQLIQFIFPLERLPGHTQELLKWPAGRLELQRWPQYSGHISVDANGRAHVYLNVFEYYMFWTAFYVLRGSRSSMADARYLGGSQDPNARGDHHWGKSLSDFKRTLMTGLHGSSAPALYAHPYFTLLDQYLAAFLPQAGSASGQAGVPAAYQAYSSFGARAPDMAMGAKLLSILVEFWLTDVAEPLPAEQPRLPAAPAAGATTGGVVGPAGMAAGMASPAGSLASPSIAGRSTPTPSSAAPGTARSTMPLQTVLSYQPASEEVLQGITQLLRHLHVAGGHRAASNCSPGGRPLQPAQAHEPWLVETPVRTMVPAVGQRTANTVPPPTTLLGGSASPAVQAVSRKVYRLLRRTFVQWPQASSTSLVPVIQLWLTLITPWAGATPASSSTTTGGAPSRATAGGPGPAGPQAHSGGGAHAGGLQGQVSALLGSEITTRLSHLTSWQSSGGAPDATTQTSGPQGCPYHHAWRGHVLAHLPLYCCLIPHFLELIYARLAYRGDAAACELLLLLRGLQAAGPGLLAMLKDVEAAVNKYRTSSRQRVSGRYAELLPWLVEQAADWEAAAAAGAPTSPAMQVNAAFRLFTTDNNSAAFYGAAVLRAAQTQVKPELRDALEAVLMEVLPMQKLPDLQAPPAAPLDTGMPAQQYPRAGQWTRVHYKGDRMTRPVASNEIGPLVHATVALSKRLNAYTGLDQPWTGDAEDPPETVYQQGIAALRRRDFRISLRFLAEKQVLAWLLPVGLYFLYRLYRRIAGPHGA